MLFIVGVYVAFDDTLLVCASSVYQPSNVQFAFGVAVKVAEVDFDVSPTLPIIFGVTVAVAVP